MGYGGYAVEAGVACDIDVVDADGGEELFALLVLHEEVGEALEHMSVGSAVPAEEDLVGTEDAADAIDRHATMAQDVNIVVPELVFDEECHGGAHGAQEAQCVGWCVDGQVADEVGELIVFAHLIA